MSIFAGTRDELRKRLGDRTEKETL